MRYQYIEGMDYYDLYEMIESQLRINSPLLTATQFNQKTNKVEHVKYIAVGAGFDTETSKVETGNESIPFVSFVYHWQFGIGEIAFLGRTCQSHVDFLEVLMDVMELQDKNVRLLVGDANLGYEWQFLKHYWAKFGITRIFVKEKRDPLMVEVGNRIVFREIIGLFGTSLAQIAKNYCGIEKLIGDLDFTKVRIDSTPLKETEIGYTVRDVEIIVILFEKHIYLKYYGQNPRLPYTSTGMVRDEIKRRLGKLLKEEREKIALWMPDDEKIYEAFRLYLFKGGISGSNIIHMNKTYYANKPVIGADITSDYPYQLLTKKFPMGKAEKCSNREFRRESIPYIALVRFEEFRARTPHALMSAHKVLNSAEMMNSDTVILDNNRIQYGESVELLINDVEYTSLKKAYKWSKVIILSCWKFEKYSYLPKHITETCIDWYKKKEELKSKGLSKTLDYKESKRFVNAIYGMMCTALNLQDYQFDEEEEEITEEEAKDYSEAIKYLFLSPYWGFWITSYAREMLIDVITRFPRVIIQYDTDSVYFIDDGSVESIRLKEYLQMKNRQMIERNKGRFQDKHMETIGTWDFTKPFKRFKALGSKRYMYEDDEGIHVTIAGCRKYEIEGKERSTLLDQADFEGVKDYFDFFKDGMKIDKEHSKKLRSIYIDTPIDVIATDYEGRTASVHVPSCVVLEEVDFTMSLAKAHNDLWIAVERYYKNSTNQSIADMWREHIGINSNVKKKKSRKEGKQETCLRNLKSSS